MEHWNRGDAQARRPRLRRRPVDPMVDGYGRVTVMQVTLWGGVGLILTRRRLISPCWACECPGPQPVTPAGPGSCRVASRSPTRGLWPGGKRDGSAAEPRSNLERALGYVSGHQQAPQGWPVLCVVDRASSRACLRCGMPCGTDEGTQLF